MGKGFGQIDAKTRYDAARSTPWVQDGLKHGRLLGAYSGIDRRSGPKRLADLDYLFLPQDSVLTVAGRIVDSVVLRERASASPTSGYVEVSDETGARHRWRASNSAAHWVGRLSPREVSHVLASEPLVWRGEMDALVWAFEEAELNHPPMLLVSGRPATQSIIAAAPVTAWEAQIVELLRQIRSTN